MSIHTIDPQFRLPGFFTKENINTISELITMTIAQDYHGKKVVVPDEYIVRYMQKVHEEKIESIGKMNQRVIMDVVRTFVNHVEETERNNMWANNRWNAYNRDESLGIKPYDTIKLKGERVGKNDARSFQFQFTY